MPHRTGRHRVRRVLDLAVSRRLPPQIPPQRIAWVDDDA